MNTPSKNRSHIIRCPRNVEKLPIAGGADKQHPSEIQCRDMQGRTGRPSGSRRLCIHQWVELDDLLKEETSPLNTHVTPPFRIWIRLTVCRPQPPFVQTFSTNYWPDRITTATTYSMALALVQGSNRKNRLCTACWGIIPQYQSDGSSESGRKSTRQRPWNFSRMSPSKALPLDQRPSWILPWGRIKASWSNLFMKTGASTHRSAAWG